MVDVVEVTLKISVTVDDEYSPADHANDIVKNARRVFSEAGVSVVDVRSRSDQIWSQRLGESS